MCCSRQSQKPQLIAKGDQIKKVSRSQDGRLKIRLSSNIIYARYPINFLRASDPIADKISNAIKEDIKIFVDSSEHLNNRRERVNQFYWLISALILSGEFAITKCILDFELSIRSLLCACALWAVSTLGSKVCCLWKRTLENYGKISFAKVAILRGLEEFRASQIFTCQGDLLGVLNYTAQTELEEENANLLSSVQESVRLIASIAICSIVFFLIMKVLK